MQPHIRYAKSGDVHVAYAVYGSGPFDVIAVPGFISHLEYLARVPQIVRFFERVSSFCRLITFDKRGTGLSDPVAGAATLEERVDDLRAVLDAVGSQRAAILGWSEGGPMALLFAAMHPERTSSLILYAAYARLAQAPDYPRGITPDQIKKLEGLVAGWGQGVGLSTFAPSVAHDPEARALWAGFQRVAASPGMASALLRLYPQIDVRSILPAIQVPTLILHRSGDRVVNVEHGRYLAANIAGSKYVELDGIDHNFWIGDLDRLTDEIEEFLTGVRHADEHDRSLQTLLFIDVVSSTERAEAIGDKAWQVLLIRYQGAVRTALAHCRGTEVDNAGDGFFATFDGPARAVRCASMLRDSVHRLGMQVRVGIHTGECLRTRDRVTGAAVHIASRIVAKADPDQILVSSTVKELVVGSGLKFGTGVPTELKGVEGTWTLFALEE